MGGALLILGDDRTERESHRNLKRKVVRRDHLALAYECFSDAKVATVLACTFVLPKSSGSLSIVSLVRAYEWHHGKHVCYYDRNR